MGADVNDAIMGRASCEVVPFRLPFWVENRLRMAIEPTRSFLGDGLLFEGARVLVTGATGVGKTLFSMSMVEAVCSGREFLDFAAGEAARVLYIDYEVGRRVMRERLIHLDVPPETLAVVCCDDPELGDKGLLPLDDPTGQRQLLEIVEAYHPGMMVIDNLYSACAGSILGGGDRSGAGQAHEHVVPFIRGLSRRGICTVLVHHTGNDRTRPYGDSRMAWQMTAHLHLDRPDDAVGVVLKVSTRKLRAAAQHEPFVATWDRGVWTHGCDMPAPRRPLSAGQKIVYQALVDAIDAGGEPVPAGPTGACGVTGEAWRNRYYAKRPLEDEANKNERDARSKLFREARDAIEAVGLAASSPAGWWWLTSGVRL